MVVEKVARFSANASRRTGLRTERALVATESPRKNERARRWCTLFPSVRRRRHRLVVVARPSFSASSSAYLVDPREFYMRDRFVGENVLRNTARNSRARATEIRSGFASARCVAVDSYLLLHSARLSTIIDMKNPKCPKDSTRKVVTNFTFTSQCRVRETRRCCADSYLYTRCA